VATFLHRPGVTPHDLGRGPYSRRLLPALIGSVLTLAFPLAFAAPPDTAPPPAPTETPPPSEPPAESIDPQQLQRMQQQLDALEAEVEQLRGELDEARAQPEPAPAPAPETETEIELEIPPTPKPVGSVSDGQRPPGYADGFHFGSYGRVVAAGDLRGRPGRDADIVGRGSRFDESTYAELELRREDYWKDTGASTRVVATLAVRHPIFHYNGNFDAAIALRNLYLEEVDLGAKGLSVWAGSRMYRGDDIYVLDWWPLDNLNTIGGGAGYQFKAGPFIKIHAGVNQPNTSFFRQTSGRPLAFNQPGEAEVAILDRQQIISSAKLGHVFDIGQAGAGVKLIGYGETHHVRAGSREVEGEFAEYEGVPADNGYVAGGEVSMFTGKRSTHLNVWVRHAWDLAAYGEFARPTQLAPDLTTKGARELIVALGGNYEIGFFGVMVGAYFRRYRNASPALDIDDLNEGIVLLRPQFWFGKIAGTAIEASYQAQQRAVLPGLDTDASGPLFASLWRVGVMPFLTPGGRGSYARPHIRAWYMVTIRDDGARSLYAQDDVFALRKVDHLLGLGAEWWFGSTSYFRD
jgi:maltoporin